MAQKNWTPEGVMEIIKPLPGLSLEYIPFRAQHVILQAIQRHLESHAFQFIRKWLLPEALMVGWTCPESLELHQIFWFLDSHGGKINNESFCLTLRAIQRWRRVITSIRHAAVHRVPQDRSTLLRMIRAAVKFSRCIVGFSCSEMLRRLYKFLNVVLSKSDQLTAQLGQKVDSQISMCAAYPQGQSHRLKLLPEAVSRVLEHREENLLAEVNEFLRAEFK